MVPQEEEQVENEQDISLHTPLHSITLPLVMTYIPVATSVMCTVTLESLASRNLPVHGSHLPRSLHLSTTQSWQQAFAYVHFDNPYVGVSWKDLEHLLDAC